LRTVTTLREEGYSDISTQEVLIRTHDIPQPTGSSLSSITEIVERLKSHEARKEERRVLQMKTARERSAKIREKAEAATEATAEAKAEGSKSVEATEATEVEKGAEESAVIGEKRGAEESTEATGSKKPRLEADGVANADASTNTPSANRTPRARDQSKIEHLQSLLAAQPPTRTTPTWTEPDPYPSSLILTKPAAEMRGHTSYLTFATLHPLAIRNEVAPAPKSRVDQLKEEEVVGSPTEGSGSDYGSEGLEEVMRTMTEEEMMSLAAV
jgi:tRNA (adenine57-N1/adenine58-N1)-methyltransferase